MSAILSRLLLLTARHAGRHVKQVTEGETARTREVLALWRGISTWL